MVNCACNHFPASLGNVTFDAGVGIGAPPSTSGLNVNGLFHTTHNTQTAPSSDPGGGLTVAFNRIPGRAEVDLYNVYPDAVESFRFAQVKTAGQPLDLMTILGSGNVGIGTTRPETRFHVSESQLSQLYADILQTSIAATNRAVPDIMFFYKHHRDPESGQHWGIQEYSIQETAGIYNYELEANGSATRTLRNRFVSIMNP